MSVFSFLGKAAKGLGKGVLAVTKTAVNVAGGVAGIGAIFPTGGSQQATVQSLQVAPPISQGGGSLNAGTPSLLDLGKDALAGIGNFLNGRTHAQVDANVGAGGRLTDPTGSGLPSWLIPVGIGGALLLMLSGGNKRRRY